MDALILTTADRDEMLFSVPHCHAPFGQSIEAYNAELERWVENFRAAGLERVNFGYILLWTRSDGGADDVVPRESVVPARFINVGRGRRRRGVPGAAVHDF